MQTNKYEEIEKQYEEGIFCVFLSLLPQKKRENQCQALCNGKQKDITKTNENEPIFKK